MMYKQVAHSSLKQEGFCASSMIGLKIAPTLSIHVGKVYDAAERQRLQKKVEAM